MQLPALLERHVSLGKHSSCDSAAVAYDSVHCVSNTWTKRWVWVFFLKPFLSARHCNVELLLQRRNRCSSTSSCWMTGVGGAPQQAFSQAFARGVAPGFGLLSNSSSYSRGGFGSRHSSEVVLDLEKRKAARRCAACGSRLAGIATRCWRAKSLRQRPELPLRFDPWRNLC